MNRSIDRYFKDKYAAVAIVLLLLITVEVLWRGCFIGKISIKAEDVKVERPSPPPSLLEQMTNAFGGGRR